MPGRLASFLDLRAFSLICGGAVALAGAGVLLGWALDASTLRSIRPGLATMKANTALCFMLAGASLLSLNLREGKASVRNLGAACASLVMAIAFVTLSEDLFRWHAGIDELLVRDPDAAAPGAPGRMSPATAANFGLVAAALLLLRRDAYAAAAQGFAAAVLVLAGLSVLGYLFGAQAFYQIRLFSTVALHTAASFVVLGAGLLAARTGTGWVREIACDTASARMGRRLLGSLFLILPLLGWLRLKGEQLGWYEVDAGVAMLVAASMVVLAWLVLWTTRGANRIEDTSRRYAERLAILHEIDRGLISNLTPETIAESALRPLRDLLKVPRAIVNLFNYETGEVEWLVAIGRQRVRVGPGVRYPLALLGDIEALRRGEPQVIDTRALPPSEHRDALLASRVEMYMAVPMIAGGELIGALSFGGEAREFPDEQVAVAREAASQLAIAVAQARLHARVQRQADELEQRVKERTAELELANKEAEAFSYTVSHDLRTPLRAVDGFARLFEEDYGGKVDGEGRRLLGVIRESSRRMGALIDDLLAFSMLGRTALHPVAVDMGALVAEVWAELGGGSPATFLVAPLPPARGDRALLKQVWANLISNALKYSAKRAAPIITVTGESRDEERVYCVADNGAGFDPRYYDKLFGVFQRLHAETEFSGTGVGLATVQRVVVRHGGRVWAESAVDAGARFYFSLPAHE